MRREPRDLRDLVGENVSAEERERLARIDALLRTVPPPPEVPSSLTRAVAQVARPVESPWTRRRLAGSVALAAALAAVFFGLGTRVGGGDGFDERMRVSMQPLPAARGAAAEIRVGERDASGNWTIELDVSGLPKLPEGGSYVLWLAKDGEYGATCGYFTVGTGTTTVRMNAAYSLADYDAWVITAHLPNQPRGAETPWLLQASVNA